MQQAFAKQISGLVDALLALSAQAIAETYDTGNRGVSDIFEKTGGDAEAPAYIQFGDHAIAPTDAGHFQRYWGDEWAALLGDVSNWATYYPANLSGEAVAEKMMAH